MGIIILAMIGVILGFLWCKWDEWTIGGIVLSLLSSIVLIFAIGIAICASSNDEICTATLVETKQAIEMRIENQENSENSIMTNGGLYTDIIEYNQTIRSYKKWTKSFWVGIFWEDGPAELELIELPSESM